MAPTLRYSTNHVKARAGGHGSQAAGRMATKYNVPGFKRPPFPGGQQEEHPPQSRQYP